MCASRHLPKYTHTSIQTLFGITELVWAHLHAVYYSFLFSFFFSSSCLFIHFCISRRECKAHTHTLTEYACENILQDCVHFAYENRFKDICKKDHHGKMMESRSENKRNEGLKQNWGKTNIFWKWDANREKSKNSMKWKCI